MTPEEIIDAYNVLAENVNTNAAQEAARIGNAQRSLGPLAERVASPSGQTYGLANYTYDRTMRPAVDTLAASLTTQGLATGLEKNLNDSLRAAKSRYEDAQNRYAYGRGNGGGGGTTGTTSNNTDANNPEVTDPGFNAVFDFDAAVESVRKPWGIYGNVAFKEDIQAKLKEAYDQGLIDESTWIRLWSFADNEYPSYNDYPIGTWNNRDDSDKVMDVPGTDAYVDESGKLVLPGSRVQS